MDTHALENLEERVEALSEHIGNYESLLNHNETVTSRFSNLQREFENLKISNIDSNFHEECKTHLDLNLNQLLETNDVKSLLMNSVAKAELVLKFEKEIREAAAMIEKIESLKRYLDFDPLHSTVEADLPEKKKVLLELEEKQIALTLDSSEEEERILAILQDYNETVLFIEMMNVNQQLIQWESRLDTSRR